MGRAPCCAKVGLRRGPWTAREDALLTKYIQRHGEGQWKSIPNKAGLLRCPKSCRLRWMNYLRPDIKRGNIIPEEEDLIVRLQALLGNRWSLIAGRLPGRTDNEIKNYWNSHLSKKLKEKGFTTKHGMVKGGRCSQRKNYNSKKNSGNYKDNSTDHGKSENRKDGLKASEVYIPKPTRFSGIIRIPPEGSPKNIDNMKETALISEEENRSNNSDMLYLNIPEFVQDGDFLYDQFAINELSPNIHDLHERLYEEYLQALNSEEDQLPMNSFPGSLFA